MEEINTIIIQCANVKYAGVAGLCRTYLEDFPVLKRHTKAAKGGNYSWSRLGQEQVRKGQDVKEERGE